MLARKDLNEENEVIIAKSLDGTKKKKRANKPNEFVTNDDFCPNCGLRLKNMPEDENNFWTEVFQRELRDSDDPAAMMAMGGRGGKPGVLLFRGWGLESRTGSEAQAQMATIRTDIEEARKKLDPAYPFIHGVEDAAKPVELPLAIRGNPENLGPEVPRHFLSILSPGEPHALQQGQRPPGTGRGYPEAAHRHARDRQPHLEGSLRHRHRRYVPVTSAPPANGRPIPTCSNTWPAPSSRTACPSRSCTARSC